MGCGPPRRRAWASCARRSPPWCAEGRITAKRSAILITVAALVLCVWAFYEVAYQASRGGESMPVYSTRRHDPYGTAALYELLRERGHPIRTLERSHLEPNDTGTLIQVLPLSDVTLKD